MLHILTPAPGEHFQFVQLICQGSHISRDDCRGTGLKPPPLHPDFIFSLQTQHRLLVTPEVHGLYHTDEGDCLRATCWRLPRVDDALCIAVLCIVALAPCCGIWWVLEKTVENVEMQTGIFVFQVQCELQKTKKEKPKTWQNHTREGHQELLQEAAGGMTPSRMSLISTVSIEQNGFYKNGVKLDKALVCKICKTLSSRGLCGY